MKEETAKFGCWKYCRLMSLRIKSAKQVLVYVDVALLGNNVVRICR
jgi:hypothetical protein